MSAVISECGTYRYRLERDVQADGLVYAYFGVNGSTATATENDQTVKKWIGFTQRFGGRRFLVGNLFGFRATDVKELAGAEDPMGPDNARHIAEIIEAADVLVPCWGARAKLPKALRWRCDAMRDRLRASGKPVMVFGLTKDGDPLHPQMLGYDTKLVDWSRNV